MATWCVYERRRLEFEKMTRFHNAGYVDKSYRPIVRIKCEKIPTVRMIEKKILEEEGKLIRDRVYQVRRCNGKGWGFKKKGGFEAVYDFMNGKIIKKYVPFSTG